MHVSKIATLFRFDNSKKYKYIRFKYEECNKIFKMNILVIAS